MPYENIPSPEEKAQELVDQMFNVDFDEDLTDSESHQISHLHAIRCAKIAANHVLSTLDWHEFEVPNNDIAYWQFVIEQLEIKEQKAKESEDE